MPTTKKLDHYPGIAVQYNPSTDPYFEVMVSEALGEVARLRTGKALLSGIAAANPAVKLPGGVTVMILPTEKKLEVIRKGYQYPTNTSDTGMNEFNEYRNMLLDGYFAEDDTRECQQVKAVLLQTPQCRTSAENGNGSAAVVRFSNTVRALNSGLKNPPFVGLAHELIHALHSLKGENKGGSEEEQRTVGLGKYSTEKLCENAIRRDAGLPNRDAY